MDINKTGSSHPREYSFITGDKEEKVHPSRSEIAEMIDVNQDGILQEKELKDYMRKDQILIDDRKNVKVNTSRVMKEFKAFLKKEELPEAKLYHNFAQVESELKALEKQYPDLAKLVSLGKTHEGRDIWAIKISKGAQEDTSSKPGIIITGAHHAREWASVEVPLYLANLLIKGYSTDEKMQRRVNEAEIWIVPVVNPDGFEYSRTQSSMWRKNRNPITDTGCRNNMEGENSCNTAADEKIPIGVDLNRNYYDGNPDHFYLYRPPGDKPCNTWDDFSATSDNPNSSTYRGPKGASEKEIQALLKLEERKNIKGIIDHHSYGKLILYPWGYTYDEPPNASIYKEIGNQMAKAMSKPYKVQQSSDLYPASGTSEDCANINNRLSFTIEIGDSFQPPESQVALAKKDVSAANLAFIDWIIDHK